MELEAFAKGIAFKGIQPFDPGVFLAVDTERIAQVCTADFSNTVFPEKDSLYKTLLAEVCKTPRMSTLAIGVLIHKIVCEMSPEHQFVNVGVWNGFTYFAGIANNPDKKAVGIDNFSEFGGPKDAFMKKFDWFKSENHQFYVMDYERYFKSIHSGTIGFYIYDGNHSRESQKKGLEVAEPFFSDDCIILIDDTNTEGPLLGTKDFLDNTSHRYKVILDQKTAHNQHPTFWNGIAILQKAR